MQRLFSLIGYPLSHSFSKEYFTEKFKKEGIIDSSYELYPLAHITQFPELLATQPELVGLNVTIPYKEAVIPFLDELEEEAKSIGAVNTITIRNGKTKGYNTDAYGFEMSFKKHLQPHHQKALVLGTGGASKAVLYVLRKLNIPFLLVSRNTAVDRISYGDITPELLSEYSIIINTSPLGMYPATEACPALPYSALSPDHYLYDLIYNPSVTTFLQKGKEAGATTVNGLEMLHLQAEKAWEIWNKPE
jgi:shikimate dehydrogenase